MDKEELGRIIEAILFAAGDPVPVERIALAAGVTIEEVVETADMLADSYAYQRRGIRILRLEDSYQMCSDRELISYITIALETRKPPKLSQAQLEVLTVIAYYQPATKALVEELRGVDCSYSISSLLSKKLIEESGRLNVPGRPILYTTTADFLRCFGLNSLAELPEIRLTELSETGRIGSNPEGQLSMEPVQSSATEND